MTIVVWQPKRSFSSRMARLGARVAGFVAELLGLVR